MKNDNDTTLQSYQDHTQDYVAGTPRAVDGAFQAWIDQVLALVPAGGAVLELGSAFGRDADYIKARGYQVTATDAVPGFVDLLKQAGHQAKLLNALTDDFGHNEYNLLFANAVLLHFTPAQVDQVLAKARACLKPAGILAFSVKKGNGSGWSEEKLQAPRYFHYWQQTALEPVVVAAGFTIVEISSRTGPNAEWLHVIARK